MNALSEKQTGVQEILQPGHSSVDSANSSSRRNRYPNLRHGIPPSKLDSKLELPCPVTSTGNERPSKLEPISRRALLMIAFLCLAATCWNIARFATVRWEIDGRPAHVQVSGTLEYVPKEMREAGNVPWWKVARVKLDVEVDVDDPDVATSPTRSEELARWWGEEVLRRDIALLG